MGIPVLLGVRSGRQNMKIARMPEKRDWINIIVILLLIGHYRP